MSESRPPDIRSQIADSEAMKRIGRFNHLMESLAVFLGNHRELVKSFEHYDDPKRGLELHSMRTNYKLEDLQRETTRRLHNFLASAFALVDHARRLQRHIESYGKAILGYHDRIDSTFADNGMAQFIKGLRNYVLHYGMPYTASSFSFTTGRSTLSLQKNLMLRFKRWNPRAKAYLVDQPDEIDLKQLAEEYRELVVNFYTWFEKAFEETHEDEFREMEEINDRIDEERMAWTSWSIRQTLQTPGLHKSLASLESGFIGALGPQEWRRIDRLEAIPMIRCHAILDVLRQRGLNDEELFAEIKSAFARLTEDEGGLDAAT